MTPVEQRFYSKASGDPVKRSLNNTRRILSASAAKSLYNSHALQVQFSPDGRWIVSASFDKSVKLWDGVKGTFITTFRGHVRPVYQVSWSSDSRLVVSGSSDSTLKVHKQHLPYVWCLWCTLLKFDE